MKIYMAGISSPLIQEKEMWRFLKSKKIKVFRILIPYERSLANFNKFRWVKDYVRSNKNRRMK